MPDVLNQSQIDALLKSFSSGEAEATPENRDEKKTKDYDFRSPKKFTKEQLRTMDSLHENLARLFSSYFSGVLRLFCEVSILQIEEQRYYEFNNALPDTALLGLVDLKPKIANLNESTLMVDVSQNICFFMIDRLLGGSGEGSNYSRDFTDIELPILRSVYTKLTSYIQESWRDYIDVTADLNSIETNPRLIQVYAPEDIVVIVVLKVKFKNLEGTITICIPAVGLEEMLGDFTSKYMRISKKLSDAGRESTRKTVIRDSLYESNLELKVIFDQTQLDLSEVMRLRVNDVIPLNKKLNSSIYLSVDDAMWFTASLGNVKSKKAVKVKGMYNH